MKFQVLLFVLLGFAVVGIALLRLATSRHGRESASYEKTSTLFSPAERSFLGVLEQALGSSYRVFGKVRVADVVTVKSNASRAIYLRAFNRISAKHFDFVVCDAAVLSVLCVIELNDKSHKRKKSQERDAFLGQICSEIGLPLVTFAARADYVLADVRKTVTNASQTAVTSPADCTTAVNIVQPSCPKCAAAMIRRTMKTGSKAGEEFWGCSTFPACSGVRLNR